MAKKEKEERKKSSYPKWVIPVVLVVVILLIAGGWIGSTYNSLITRENNVDNAWAKVDSAIQRRADLIPNLVATVKAYSDYEGEVLTEITEARASIANANTPQELAEADAELDSALARLLVVVENYPNLKANENYMDLQVQLERTENRIKIERDNYSDAVTLYNNYAERFPTNIIANLFGFKEKEVYQALPGSEEVPDVEDMFN